MAPAIVLVDDQRDILRLLHSALDTLRNPDLEILEAISGEAALEYFGERHVDLLVTDYNLPGITGTELFQESRSIQPDLRAILITANPDRSVREEMLDAGALAVFSKPVPLGDFLDAVERGLGMARTLLPAATEQTPETSRERILEMMAKLCQDVGARAVLLISNRGLVALRTGELRDSSMEVSLISTLSAAFAASMKVADSNHQEHPEQFSLYEGGDQDLILMPVDATYALVVAGGRLSAPERLPRTLQNIQVVKRELAKGLRYIAASVKAPKEATQATKPADMARAGATLEEARPQDFLSEEDLDAYWDAAATQHANKPLSKDVITYEEARKMGLTPGADEK